QHRPAGVVVGQHHGAGRERVPTVRGLARERGVAPDARRGGDHADGEDREQDPAGPGSRPCSGPAPAGRPSHAKPPTGADRNWNTTSSMRPREAASDPAGSEATKDTRTPFPDRSRNGADQVRRPPSDPAYTTR